jgi:hypothetical protein
VISIKLGDSIIAGSPGAVAGSKKGGFKKSGFKSAFVSVEGDVSGGSGAQKLKAAAGEGQESALNKVGARSQLIESDTEDEGYDVYDPNVPTD